MEEHRPSYIAVIPARGGSKRIKDKNIVDFCGKPMMVHALDAARESGLFDVVHVSTDSARIAAVAADAGFPVDFMRAASLCDDHTPLMPVLQWVLRQYQERGQSFDAACLIMPCAPLIEACDLTEGEAAFARLGGTEPIIAVAPLPVPIEQVFRRNPDGRLRPIQADKIKERSQDLEEAYFDTGTYIYFPSDWVVSDTPPGAMDYVSIMLPAHKAVDINDAEQIELAKVLYVGRQALAGRKPTK